MALSTNDVQFIICEKGSVHCYDYAKTRELAERKARQLENENGKIFTVETFEEHDARQSRYYFDETPLQEIDGERFNEMLGVLPPMYRKGAPGFFMCEFTSGSITNQYVELDGKFYYAAVDMLKPSTWITREKIRAFAGESVT